MVLEGISARREPLLAGWLLRLERELDRLANGGWPELRAEWEALAPRHRGHPVRVREGGVEFDAVSAGIDEDGAQLVVRADGERVRVLSGSVSLR